MFTYKINGVEYECEFKITSKSSGSGINLNEAAIRGMSIEETLLMPYTSGNIYVVNADDWIEDDQQIRGDGRDSLTVRMKPIPGKGASDNVSFNYDFVITGETNSQSNVDRTGNFKIYTLLQREWAALNEPIPYGKRYRGYTGDIINRIFKDHDIPLVDGYDRGDHFISVFPEHVLAPTSFRYSDLILYLLRIGYSKELTSGGETYVKSMLYWDRVAGGYRLESMAKLWQSPDIIECVTPGDLVDKVQVNCNDPPPGPPVYGYIGPMHNSNLSTPMLRYSNEFIMNTLVEGYDPVIGEHGLREVRIGDLKPMWAEIFTRAFQYVWGPPQPWCVLNEAKQTEMFRTLSFPFDISKALPLATSDMMANMTYYNMVQNIQTLGRTDRRPGKYMDVAVHRPYSEKEAARGRQSLVKDLNHRMDAKALGTWQITRCRHKFFSTKVDSYQVEMELVKTHLGPCPGAPPDCDVGGI